MSDPAPYISAVARREAERVRAARFGYRLAEMNAGTALTAAILRDIAIVVAVVVYCIDTL